MFVIKSMIKLSKLKFPDGMDFITADGGFDVKIYNVQEAVTSKLLFCEIYLALCTQKINGMFIIKFFDMFTHNSIVYYMLLCSLYEYVKIVKPKSSRNCNSERYLVCYNFHGLLHEQFLALTTIIVNFKEDTVLYPNIEIPVKLKSKIKTFNNLIVYEQIKTIDESIKMINTMDFYFQNLLLKIFLENKMTTSEKIAFLTRYKNILQSRIKKSIDFLRMYNINIHQIKL